MDRNEQAAHDRYSELHARSINKLCEVCNGPIDPDTIWKGVDRDEELCVDCDAANEVTDLDRALFAYQDACNGLSVAEETRILNTLDSLRSGDVTFARELFWLFLAEQVTKGYIKGMTKAKTIVGDVVI